MSDPIEVQAMADRMADAINEVWPLQCPMCPNQGDVAAAVVGVYMDTDGWPVHLRGQVPPWMERVPFPVNERDGVFPGRPLYWMKGERK